MTTDKAEMQDFDEDSEIAMYDASEDDNDTAAGRADSTGCDDSISLPLLPSTRSTPEVQAQQSTSPWDKMLQSFPPFRRRKAPPTTSSLRRLPPKTSQGGDFGVQASAGTCFSCRLAACDAFSPVLEAGLSRMLCAGLSASLTRPIRACFAATIWQLRPPMVLAGGMYEIHDLNEAIQVGPFGRAI